MNQNFEITAKKLNVSPVKKPGILGLLPNELLLLLFQYIDFASLVNLTRVCRFFAANQLLINELNFKIDIEAYADNSYFLIGGHAFIFDSSTPEGPLQVELPNGKFIKRIFAGLNHTFYLDIEGNAFVSGTNTYGAFGLGDDLVNEHYEQPHPFQLPFDKRIETFVVSDHISFIKDTKGTWYGCGNNKDGQLGMLGSQAYYSSLQAILLPGDLKIERIVACGNRTFIKDHLGGWHGCGYAYTGYLGINTKETKILQPIPIFLQNDKKIKDIVAGDNSTFIQDEDGNWFACGYNDVGQLGVGDIKEKNTLWNSTVDNYIKVPTPVTLSNNRQINKIMARDNHTYFLDNQGQWHSCGMQGNDVLGISAGYYDKYFSPQPMKLMGDTCPLKFVAGGQHTFYFASDYRWRGFGYNFKRQLSFERPTSIAIPALIQFGQFKIPSRKNDDELIKPQTDLNSPKI